MSFKTQIYELKAPKVLHLREEELIDAQNDELIAKTIYTAISPGTELAAYLGVEALREGKAYPRVLGYCNIARVIHKGHLQNEVEVGDSIISFQSHRTFFKISNKDFFLKVPSNISLKNACTAYLYHLGYHAFLSAGIKAGNKVGIIGMGVLGCTSALMCNVGGCQTTIFSNQKGINEDFFQIRKKENSNPEEHFDVIINTSNTWNDWEFALQTIGKGGTILNLGFPGRGEPLPTFNPLAPQYVYAKQISIKALCQLDEMSNQKGNFSIKRNLAYILNLMERNIINPKDIISDEVSFKDLEKQYQKYVNRTSTLFTSILNWQ